MFLVSVSGWILVLFTGYGINILVIAEKDNLINRLRFHHESDKPVKSNLQKDINGPDNWKFRTEVQKLLREKL